MSVSVALSPTASRVLSGTYALTAIGCAISAVAAITVSAMGLTVSGILMWLILFAVSIGLMLYASSESDPVGRLLAALGFFAVMGVMASGVTAMPWSALLLAGVSTFTVFAALSLYVVITQKNFNSIGGFLLVAIIALIVMSIANIFIGSSVVSLMLSYAGVVIFSGFVLYDTSRIVSGEETDFISGAISMYLNIMNLFQSFVGIFSSHD